MQDGARFFAYSTWTVMISLGMVMFAHQFFQFMDESTTLVVIILFMAGFLYFNLAFAAIKRFIKKVPAPTSLHMLLGFIIFLPPFLWLLIINDTFSQNELLLSLVLVLSIGLGTMYGNRSGIKARYEYVQKLKEYQKKTAGK